MVVLGDYLREIGKKKGKKHELLNFDMKQTDENYITCYETPGCGLPKDIPEQ